MTDLGGVKAVILLFASLILGCAPSPSVVEGASSVEPPDATVTSDTTDTLEAFDEFADLFVTVADTGHNYETLLLTMNGLRKEAGVQQMEQPINAYDPERDSLMIALDSEDEIYRGTYVLRRSVDPSMSIEYLDAYDTAAIPGTMAVVTGIWSTQEEADSIARAHSSVAPVSIVIPARLYQGCIH